MTERKPLVLYLTTKQIETLREAVRYFCDDMVQSGMPDRVADNVLQKIDAAIEDRHAIDVPVRRRK